MTVVAAVAVVVAAVVVAVAFGGVVVVIVAAVVGFVVVVTGVAGGVGVPCLVPRRSTLAHDHSMGIHSHQLAPKVQNL